MASPFAFSTMATAITTKNTNGDNNNNINYAPPNDMIMEHMAAGAFRSLCEHLRLRSDLVQNMDLMTISGFCRNCLAKWMVIEARKLKQQCLNDDGSNTARLFAGNDSTKIQQLINALDSFGYDEAAKEVYGVTYPEWKKRHQKKATEEQLRLYKESMHLHAKHDSETLKTAVNSSVNKCPLSKRALIRLQAGAFTSLCHHLRIRSDTVPNMELMTISGFCRNCLAKWLVVEARRISEETTTYFLPELSKTIQSLDSFGYDEAARYVYGCTYPEWKKRHQQKATDKQMERYNGSKHLHAKHDKELLATRVSNDGGGVTSLDTAYVPDVLSGSTQNIQQAERICVREPTQQTQQASLLSDVCCQDVDTAASPTDGIAQSPNAPRQILRPPKGNLQLRVGILTVSDRAAANAYESGDLSGPAVERTVVSIINQMNATFTDQTIGVTHVEKQIVADEILDIQEVILHWSGKAAAADAQKGANGGDISDSPATTPFDMIFTTGGTGFAPRDITPEATLSILDRECHGLMSWASAELTARQPLATLSRAAAGVCGETLVANLPGNPSGAAQVVDVLFPLLLHAVRDLRGGR